MRSPWACLLSRWRVYESFCFVTRTPTLVLKPLSDLVSVSQEGETSIPNHQHGMGILTCSWCRWNLPSDVHSSYILDNLSSKLHLSERPRSHRSCIPSFQWSLLPCEPCDDNTSILLAHLVARMSSRWISLSDIDKSRWFVPCKTSCIYMMKWDHISMIEMPRTLFLRNLFVFLTKGPWRHYFH